MDPCFEWLNFKLLCWLTKLQTPALLPSTLSPHCDRGHLTKSALDHFSKAHHGEEVLKEEEDDERYDNDKRQGEIRGRTKRIQGKAFTAHAGSEGG